MPDKKKPAKDYFSQFEVVQQPEEEDYFSQFETVIPSKGKPIEAVTETIPEPEFIPESEPEKSFLGKVWDFATTGLAGHEATQEEWARDPRNAMLETGLAGMTSPIGIAGELLGGIGALKGISRLRNIGKATEPLALPPASYRFSAGPTGEITDLFGGVAKTPPRPTSVTKLLEKLEQAKPLNKEQAAIYKTERAEKFARTKDIPLVSEESFFKRKGQLAGEHTKVSMEPLELDQVDVDTLFKQIGDSPGITTTETIHAGDGLRKILDGRVPQNSELEQLKKVFGPDVVEQIRAKLPKIDTQKKLVQDIINVPRALQASLDISFPFRQGLGLIHTKAWWTSWDDMIKSYGSEKAYRAVMESVQNNPYAKRTIGANGKLQQSLAERAGLALTDLTELAKREEAIMSTLAERIPGVGRAVRASNRGYTAFANKLRMDNFTSLIDLAKKQGLDPEKNTELAKEIASYVNAASGRGKLPKQLERSAATLNTVFFSPRLIASRMQMMNPRNYIMAPKLVRQQYLKSLMSTATTWLSMATLGKMAGADVSLDPNNADFGKIKIGNTRLDPAGGFQQYIVLAHRIATGQYTTSTSGEQHQYGVGFGSKTRLDSLVDFVSNKLATVPAYGVELARAKDYQPFEVGDRTIRMFTPILIQDLSELAKADPKLLPFLIPSAVGMGVQHYGEREQNRILPESFFPRRMDISIPQERKGRKLF